ncbi:TetR/AcrR family transcriptional regulator [Schumannella sp. 10F1B-5-1]|uniref:TetR/AcrR family transcriptional regulator n=1 Tax=Schumannella sp. 10F1B-5-1 TaxID=2590780 RepID=UPI001C642F40|nr:TetR/AcrR family transcriptional regulator [Schumannella sp. 10F1B-5-1]
MVLPEEFVEVRVRARPMAPEDRRDAIIDAVIPLLMEHGRDLSTKRIAQAAGVAEGTVFRAFGDKESLIRAAVAKHFDPLPLHTRLRGIDVELPVEQKLAEVIGLLRDRMDGVIRLFTALGGDPPPDERTDPDEAWLALLGEIFDRDRDALRVGIPELAFYLRLVAFGASVPQFHAPHEFSTAELAAFVTGGVLHHTPAGASRTDG